MIMHVIVPYYVENCCNREGFGVWNFRVVLRFGGWGV